MASKVLFFIDPCFSDFSDLYNIVVTKSLTPTREIILIHYFFKSKCQSEKKVMKSFHIKINIMEEFSNVELVLRNILFNFLTFLSTYTKC